MYRIITVSWDPFKGNLEDKLNKIEGRVIQLLDKPKMDGVISPRPEFPSVYHEVAFQEVLIWVPKNETE